MEKTDWLWPGGVRYVYDESAFRPGTDTFLLGAFPKLWRGARVCDLGAGIGLLGLLLLAREPSLRVTNVELQAHAADLARRNAEENGFAEQITCLRADLRDKGQLPAAGSFDLVVANPPYFAPHSGALPPDPARRDARAETSCTLADVCAATGRLLRWGGQFCLVFRTERLAELLETLRRSGLEPKRLRLVQHDAASAPSLLLLESRRGGRPGLVVEPTLLLRDADGRETDETRRIYFRDKE